LPSLKAQEIARRLVADPSMIEGAWEFLNRHMMPDSHQHARRDVARLAGPPSGGDCCGLGGGQPRGQLLRETAPVFGNGLTSCEVSELIDASIGRYSRFHQTFGYYGDGVSPRTAPKPLDWRTHATGYVTADRLATAVCPTADDIAIARLCA